MRVAGSGTTSGAAAGGGASRPGPPSPRGRGPADGADGGVPTPRPRRRRRIAVIVALTVLVLLLAWPVGLVIWANGQLNHVDALSDAPGTPGTTYLLAGSDSRADGGVDDDGTSGARADSIMVLHVPSSGPPALISLPRDTYTKIPGHKAQKLNAAYRFGGPALLVETVEGLTGLTVDHYLDVGMGGLTDVVDAVGGVELCLDKDVKDKKSKLTWKKGCHVANGKTALAFSRMRYSDVEGDIGRGKRQQQVVGALAKKMANPGTIINPGSVVPLITSGTGAIAVSRGTNIIDLGSLALAFRDANGAGGVTGTPPIASVDHRPGGVGSTVLLDPEEAPQFFKDLAAGKLAPGKVGGMPG